MNYVPLHTSLNSRVKENTSLNFAEDAYKNAEKMAGSDFFVLGMSELNLICMRHTISHRLRLNSLLLQETIQKSNGFFCPWPLSDVAISEVLLQI